ncbi:PucR family transcriptional regulator [Actinomycetospora chiangmaiensis]|uniref:PucR family transcriptional regulator n=1 Tax=Actinomycetospora chiangmaiensis TaxID=402650 RepID=UPI0003A4F05E|nr:helix-turn-helix domain-containing protein [Actinomycetospora chiangmaiensis]
MQELGGTLPRHDDGSAPAAAVAAALARHRGEISEAIRDLLAARIDELRGDPGLIDLLGASVEGNVETIVHMLAHGLPPRRIEAPPAAVEYARRLAQRGVPVNALVRAYRLGQAHLMEWAFACVGPEDVAAVSQHVVLTVFEYVDHVSQHVVAVYEAERDRWLENRHAIRVARIRDVLDGRAPVGADDRLAIESVLGYRFAREHLGLVLWTDEPTAGPALVALERCADALAQALGATGRALVVPWDTTSAWVWLPGVVEVSRETVSGVVRRGGEAVRVACGAPAADVDGFRVTHEQALRARAVTLAAGEDAPAVTLFDEVGAVALLCADLDAATAWVRRVLGPLAEPGSTCARLRETLRVFLATGGSNATTASRLGVHPSTVKYRVRRAKEVRGRPVGDDRLDVELALLACAWLGAGR